MSLTSRLKTALLCIPLTGCFASNARVDALEAQIAQLKTPSAQDDVQARIDAAVGKSAESVSKMEEMLEVLQREVTRMASETPSAPKTAGNDSAVWAAVDAILGVEGDGVTVDGDTYTVKRSWLHFHLDALAARGKATKLGESKDGVQVRGVRPNTLPSTLGFKNGDIISKIGETQVTTTAGLVDALKAATNPLHVTVMRKKAETKLTYRVVD